MFKKIIAAMAVIASSHAGAHCPAPYKTEKACFMLEQNVIYVYDEKVKHEGPYKDLTGTLESVNSDGADLKFSRIARGVYKIDHPAMVKTVELTLAETKTKNAKKTNLKLKSE
ncbi:MAG: hypothetical protein WC635_01665 [Bacteriovorax sp.]|jgi:hypothetical protein